VLQICCECDLSFVVLAGIGKPRQASVN